MEGNKKQTYKDVFSQKEFMKMTIAALINRFGDSIDAIASTWIVYELTKSAAWSATVYAVNALPTVLITPLAGPWVEGRNKKAIMIVTDIIRCLIVAAVATLFLMGGLKPWMLIVSNLIISTVEAFRGPANMALTPNLLEEKLYSRGLALESSLTNIVQLIGTAAAAGIIAFVGVSGALYIDMVTFILSAAIIVFVDTHEKDIQKVKFEVASYFRDLKDGFKYVSRDRAIVFFLVYVVFINAILVPLNSLQAPLASEILNGGAEMLSVISVSTTIAMLVGTAIYPEVLDKLGNRMVVGIVGLGIAAFYGAIILFQPVYGNKFLTYIVVAATSFILGTAIAFGQSLVNVLFMSKVNKEYIARASGICTAGSAAATPVTSFVIGSIVTFVSIRWTFIGAAIAALIVTALVIKSEVLSNEEANGLSDIMPEEV